MANVGLKAEILQDTIMIEVNIINVKTNTITSTKVIREGTVFDALEIAVKEIKKRKKEYAADITYTTRTRYYMEEDK